eukprot:CAMPEP_0117056868 /NCGR_PEP_ID=MMETSP0472-20121206/39463_1 /TAXON_ID=693140 ORGANISM="Tiarina fusus, Strain LIS" /NCGR_SAMPLE_ID=MMETSP0472 /ASSEMBLY_ACC=CAM_ASM_000603 /LENGTH=334 /DNA_ID=CAMNT_0004773497 /DNA_START=42 /DNA_END=1046 /DNA_ORIENTATION=-
MKLLLLSFLLAVSVQAQGLCEPGCHCIPEDDEDMCPEFGNRKTAVTYSVTGVSTFFGGLGLEDEDDLFTFYPTGCQPFPLVAGLFGGLPCEGVVQKSDYDEVDGKKSSKSSKSGKNRGRCVFDYDDDACVSNKYSLKTQSKGGTKNKKGSFVTHEGPCGVCSSAQDLATNMRPDLDQGAFGCSGQIDATNPPTSLVNSFTTVQNCFASLGFTNDCALLWTSNAFNTLLFGTPFSPMPIPDCELCLDACSTITSPECMQLTMFPNDPNTCELNPCLQCDEDASGEIFSKFAGRTRRNSGIVSTVQNPAAGNAWVGVKRECDTIADIEQVNPCAPF